MEKIKNLFVWSFSFAVFFMLASTTWAQIDVGNFTISGAGEIGGLPRSLTGSKAGFEEYRDIPESVIVPQLQLIIGGKKEDFYANFDAGKVGRADQNYSLRFGKYGLLDVQFEWEQIPVLFDTNTARTPFNADGGRFTLPSRPAFPYTGNNGGNACAPSIANTNNVCNWLLGTAHNQDLSLLDKIARLRVRYTPSPGWTFTGTYWSNNDNGNRAFGVLNGFQSSTMNISELAEPISYQTHNLELGGEYAGSWWSVAAKYNGSFFHNNTSTLIWDNPIHTMLGGTTIGSTVFGGTCQDSVNYDPTNGTGPCRGRLDLYPSNQAHTFTLTGTAVLPLNTRFLATASYGWRLQTDSFLPFTINSCYTATGGVNPNPATGSCSDANFTQLPTINKHNLGGDVRPIMINTTFVNNSLMSGLNLKAYYRFYDLSNHSNNVSLPQGFIGNDRGAPVTDETENELQRYSKNTAGWEAGYNFTPWLNGKFTYIWDKWHRDGFQVVDSTSNTIGPTLDIKPLSWLLFRANYKHSWLDSDFNRDGNLVAYYLLKRIQDKVSLFTEVSPLETLSFHGGFDLTNNFYPNSHPFGVVNGTSYYGLQHSYNYSPSVGFLYAPLDWLRLFADYNWDFSQWRLNQNNSTGVMSHGTDIVNTFSLGSEMDIIKNVLGFRIQYTFSEALSKIGNNCPNVCAAPDATDYPNRLSIWHELLARLEYQITKNVGLRFGYYFNALKGKNPGVDIMRQWMGFISSPGDSAAQIASQQRSIFLGDTERAPFTAYVGFIALRLQF